MDRMIFAAIPDLLFIMIFLVIKFSIPRRNKALKPYWRKRRSSASACIPGRGVLPAFPLC